MTYAASIRAELAANNVALVTPSDVTTFDPPCFFSFAGAGAIKVDTPDQTGVVIPSGALAAGIVHPLRVTKIHNTSTTATGIVRYW